MTYVPTITPSPAVSILPLASIYILQADGTYITAAQLQSALGIILVTATAATIAGAPAGGTPGVAITGVTDTLTPSAATAYAVLSVGGADEGARRPFVGLSVPNLTPVATGSYTVKIYAANAGGAALATSSAITVA